MNQIGSEKRGLDGVIGAGILENCQNFMNRLAAQDLPPGAVAEPWVCMAAESLRFWDFFGKN